LPEAIGTVAPASSSKAIPRESTTAATPAPLSTSALAALLAETPTKARLVVRFAASAKRAWNAKPSALVLAPRRPMALVVITPALPGEAEASKLVRGSDCRTLPLLGFGVVTVQPPSVVIAFPRMMPAGLLVPGFQRRVWDSKFGMRDP